MELVQDSRSYCSMKGKIFVRHNVFTKLSTFVSHGIEYIVLVPEASATLIMEIAENPLRIFQDENIFE